MWDREKGRDETRKQKERKQRRKRWILVEMGKASEMQRKTKQQRHSKKGCCKLSDSLSLSGNKATLFDYRSRTPLAILNPKQLPHAAGRLSSASVCVSLCIQLDAGNSKIRGRIASIARWKETGWLGRWTDAWKDGRVGWNRGEEEGKKARSIRTEESTNERTNERTHGQTGTGEDRGFLGGSESPEKDRQTERGRMG